MKRLIYALIMTALLSDSSLADAIIFNADHFTIEIPDRMIVEDKTSDSISLNFEGNKNLSNGTLSASARKSDKVGTLDSQWARVKALTINGKKVLYEKEEDFGELKWKVIAVSDTTGSCEIQAVAYYSIKDNIIYMMHYHCQPDNCKSMQTAFDNVKASFRTKSDTMQPNKLQRSR